LPISADRAQELYPYMFLLPDGNLVDAGPGDTSFLLTSTWTWWGETPRLHGPSLRLRRRVARARR
jgi:hypothetical protein